MRTVLLTLCGVLLVLDLVVPLIFWRLHVIRRSSSTLLRNIHPIGVRDTGHLGVRQGSGFGDLSDPGTVLVLIEDRIRTATGWTDLGGEIMSLIKLHKQQKGNK